MAYNSWRFWVKRFNDKKNKYLWQAYYTAYTSRAVDFDMDKNMWDDQGYGIQ